MPKILTIDIGAGTMDILHYDTETKRSYKAVVQSPVMYLAQKVKKTPGSLIITGCEMGGGSFTNEIKKKAEKEKVIMSASASATVHHSIERVESLGITVVSDEKAESLLEEGNKTAIISQDLDWNRIKEIVGRFGMDLSFDCIGICAQDHGRAPNGVSHLDFRQTIFKPLLDKSPFPHTLLYKQDEIPECMNRLRAIEQTAKNIPAEDVYVMDSGFAAILGASLDLAARNEETIVVLDIATSHTVAATVQQRQIAGYFEYHTRDISAEKIEDLIPKLCDGKIEHKEILKQGGHGAYLNKSVGYKKVKKIIATGPKRNLLRTARLPITFGAPFGDNMMTGTVGLLEAIRRSKGLEKIDYC